MHYKKKYFRVSPLCWLFLQHFFNKKIYTQRTVQRMAAILCTCMIFFSFFFFSFVFFFFFCTFWRYLVVVLIYLRYWTTEKKKYFSGICVTWYSLTQSIYPSISIPWTVLCCKFLLFLMTSSLNNFFTSFSQHNPWIILIFMYT